jgi:hypothetical protein
MILLYVVYLYVYVPVNFKSLPFLLPKRNYEFREKEADATQRGGGHALPSWYALYVQCTVHTTMRILVSKNGGKMRSCSRFLLLKIVTMSTVQA